MTVPDENGRPAGPPPPPEPGPPVSPPPPPVPWVPPPEERPVAWGDLSSATIAWPGGESPGSRRPMLVLTVIVLAVVGVAVAWATLGRPAANPAIVEKAEGTAMPGRSADASTTGSASEQASLERLLPDGLVDRCGPAGVTDPQLAAVTCTTRDGFVVVYEAYPTRVLLDQGWRVLLYQRDIDRDSGACESGAPGEAGWYYDDATSEADDGRDACFLDPAGPVLLWTDYATNVRGWIHGAPDASIESLFKRWNEGDLDPAR